MKYLPGFLKFEVDTDPAARARPCFPLLLLRLSGCLVKLATIDVSVVHDRSSPPNLEPVRHPRAQVASVCADESLLGLGKSRQAVFVLQLFHFVDNLSLLLSY